MKEFVNEPALDFSEEPHKKGMQDALSKVDSEKGKAYPLLINGEKIMLEDKIISVNPSKKDEVIGYSSSAGIEQAELAMQCALEAFPSWSATTAAERVAYFDQFKKVLLARRYEITAWIVEEGGRNFSEAYSEVAQVVDFCNSYGNGMLEYEKGIPMIQTDIEANECIYLPMGVGVVIPPWNYPLALMAGMTIAALITGNTVVLKPSSETPVVAYKFVEMLMNCGIPKGVVNLVTGSGGKIGDYLVSHPKTRFVSFTGSKEVGLHISELAAKIQPDQIWIKRVIAEMGGKNAIIVDSTADFESAADGIITSAFGFQGQKCSACSRALIMDDIYDQFVPFLLDKISKIEVAPARKNTMMGPVISKSAFDKIVSYINIGKEEGKLVSGGTYDDSEGFYIAPTVFENIDPTARLGQEEIFGPVVALMKIHSFDEGLAIANQTVYALTGSVYSKDRTHIALAKKAFNVGNFYINRKTTGGMVNQQPFGGYNLSGTCAKTGIKEYLTNFLLTRTIAEKLK